MFYSGKKFPPLKGFVSEILGVMMTAAMDRQLKDLYPELLTAHEVADLLETTRTTVTNMRKRGQLGGLLTPNGNVFFLKHEVEALKARRKIEPPKIGRPRKDRTIKRIHRHPISVHNLLPVAMEANG